jgi:hypothetical protein
MSDHKELTNITNTSNTNNICKLNICKLNIHNFNPTLETDTKIADNMINLMYKLKTNLNKYDYSLYNNIIYKIHTYLQNHLQNINNNIDFDNIFSDYSEYSDYSKNIDVSQDYLKLTDNFRNITSYEEFKESNFTNYLDYVKHKEIIQNNNLINENILIQQYENTFCEKFKLLDDMFDFEYVVEHNYI